MVTDDAQEWLGSVRWNTGSLLDLNALAILGGVLHETGLLPHPVSEKEIVAKVLRLPEKI